MRRSLRPHGRGGLRLACRLLPRAVRGDLITLYGAFRLLDDAVDTGAPDAAERVAAVVLWARTGKVVREEAAMLAAVDARHPLPRRALEDFCAAMRADLAGAVARTEEGLDRYCHGVAGTVGLCVAAVLGTAAPCDREASRLGMALQRTNILRDLDEDAAAGRRYVSEEALAAAGGDRAALVRAQIARADALYDEGLAGVEHLARGRLAVAAAGHMYREILRQLERDGLEGGGRVVVPLPRRALAAARGIRTSVRPPRLLRAWLRRTASSSRAPANTT